MEAVDHGVKIPLLGGFHSGCGSSIGSEFEDRVLGVVLFHRIEVVGALQEMGSLATGIFRAYRLAVDTLRRETLEP